MIEIPVNSKMNENTINSKYNENQIPKLQRLLTMPILILNCVQNISIQLILISARGNFIL